MRITPAQYRRCCVAALAALCLIVVTGAAVRLTGSGLGCSDWPTCEEGQFVADLSFHPMIEWINRMITGLVSLAVIAAVAGSLLRRPRRRDLTRWSLALVAGVVAQIIIGAFVTLTELTYGVVALHFLVSMVLVWAAVVLWDKASRPDPGSAVEPLPAPLRSRASWLLAAGVGVLLTGPVITSAGPHAGDPDVERLPLDLSWASRIHGATVWVFVAVIIWVAVGAQRGTDPVARRRSVHLLVAAVAQGAIGYIQYFNGVPALLVGLHVAGATLVWALAVRLALWLRAPIPTDADSAAGGEPAPTLIHT